ncbi:MAG: CDP-glycerol glycerophosphotransferase family protein, partial [Acidimicrobiales bacterium]
MPRAKEAGRAGARLIHRLLPKADIAVIWGWPDHEDNVVALERALQETRLRRVFVLMTDRRSPPVAPLGPKTRCISKDGPAGWLVFLFARYVFFTHRCFMRHFPPNVISVNVWHGMPIKRIEALVEEGGGIRSTYVLATSPFWGEIMQRSMGPGPEALVTGLPRNDRL